MADTSQLLVAFRHTPPVRFDEQRGAWHVGGYDDVKRVVSDHEVFSSVRSDPAWPQDNPLTGTMLLSDPPRQRQLRALVSQAFTPSRIAALEARVTDIAHELVDGSGKIDVVAHVARPLPSTVIADLLGVDHALMPVLERWVRALFVAMAGAPDADQARVLREMEEYFVTTARDRRARPRDDFFSALATARVDGRLLDERDVARFCNLLLAAGLETTANLIGNAVICLENDAALLERVRDDLSLLPAVVEETLRFMTPIRYTVRLTTVDVQVGGVEIPAGRSVLAWFAAANRDPRRFPDPDVFDVGRDTSGHLAFGHGVHFCLGLQLARLEARAALTAMVKRFRGRWRLPDGPLEPVPAPNTTGAISLPLTWSG